MYSRTRYLPDNTTYHASLYVAIRSTPVLTGAAIKSLTVYRWHTTAENISVRKTSKVGQNPQ